MYHEKVVEKRLDRFAESIQKALEGSWRWRETSAGEAQARVKELQGAWDPEKGQIRALTGDEEAWILHEVHRCKADFAYWATRYAFIKTKGQELRLFSFLESQEWILKKVGEAELAAFRGQSGDGVLLQILKARQLGCCLDPTTRVLTDTLEWVPIDQLAVGSQVVAVDEMPPGGRGAGRKMRTARVEAKRDVWEPAFRLELEDGTVVTATGPHRFLFRKRENTATEWRRVQDVCVGDEVRSICTPWDGEQTVEDGWFGGLLDGEGCLRVKARAGVELCVAQVAGAVLDRARSYLAARHYTVREEIDRRKGGATSKLGNKPVHKLVLSRMSQLFPLLGKTRPTRFGTQRWWEGKELPGRRIGQGWLKVVGITPLGVQRMVDIQTSEKTFIAEGVVSHNSTLTEAMIAHRVIFYSHTTALVAGDVPDQSMYLFEMILRIYDNLPWWMQPKEKFRVKGKQLAFAETDSQVLVESGKATRGGDAKEKGGLDKGSIGTGKTYPLVHLSELALWPNAGQLDDALEPAIPRHMRTLAVYESTAKGRQNWWHEKWLASREGYGRFTPIFIPWYAENVSYTRPAPTDYTPSDLAVAHAKRAEAVSQRWLGKVVRLSKDQLYWWETTRADYIRRKKLHKFLAEYAADDLEAFQHSGASIFGAQMLHELRQRAAEPMAVLDVMPGSDYATSGV